MMRKILNIVLAAAIFASTAIPSAFADGIDDVMFRPGDEYKDVDFDNLGKEEETVTYIQTAGMVSYSDVSDMEKVGILGALDILGEYEPGLFKPNVYVSRAEYVEALMKLFKLDYEHDPKVNGRFYDVDADSEYYNLVYNAYDAGIADGYTDNNFYPESALTYAEAQNFAIKALGYGKIAKNYGETYAKLFADLKLNKGLSVKNASALTRMEIGIILYNVLNTPMLKMAYFNTDNTYSTQKDDTPLYEIHNVEKAEGIITANRVTGYDGVGTGRDAVIINGRSYGIPSGIVNSYIGCNTEFWYDLDSDDILYILKDRDVHEITAYDKDIKSFDIRARQMTYDDGNRRRTVSFYENSPVFYNGVKLAGNYGLDLFNITSGSIRMVSNSGDDKEFDAVFIESYDNYYVSSSSIDADEARVFVNYDQGMLQFNLSDAFVEIYDTDGSYYEVYKTTDAGDEITDISAISKGKIASVYADNEGWIRQSSTGFRTLKSPKYVKIVLSDKSAEGSIGLYNEADEEIEMDVEEGSETFAISGSNYFSHNDSMPQIGKSGTLLLDARGEAVCIVTGKSDWKYGYLIKMYYNDSDDKPERIKFFTTGGKVYTYSVSENLRINGRRYKNGQQYKDAIKDSAQLINPTFKEQQVIKYILDTTDEENPIMTEIQVVTQSVGVSSDYDNTQLNRDVARGNYYVETDTEGRLKNSYEYASYFKPTLTITVPSEEKYDPSGFSAAQITSSSTFSADVYNVTDLVPDLLVRYADASAEEGVKTYGRFTYPLMYIKSKVALDEDDNVRLEINVASGWNVLTLYSDDLSICSNLKKGDLACFYQYDDSVTRIDPVVWTMSGDLRGERINPEHLPSVSSNDNLSLKSNGEFGDSSTSYQSFGEVWSVNGSNMVVQYGQKTSGGKREHQLTGRFSHGAWMHGGVILYQEEDDGVSIRQGTIADVRPANTWGDKASRVLWVPIHGAGRQYIIYNFK